MEFFGGVPAPCRSSRVVAASNVGQRRPVLPLFVHCPLAGACVAGSGLLCTMHAFLWGSGAAYPKLGPSAGATEAVWLVRGPLLVGCSALDRTRLGHEHLRTTLRVKIY